MAKGVNLPADARRHSKRAIQKLMANGGLVNHGHIVGGGLIILYIPA